MFDENEEQENKLKEEKKKIRDRELEDIKTVLELPGGRRFLWRILTEARILGSCFHDDSQRMAYYEGRRDVGLFVLEELTKANKNALSKIQNEYFSEIGKTKRGK